MACLISDSTNSGENMYMMKPNMGPGGMGGVRVLFENPCNNLNALYLCFRQCQCIFVFIYFCHGAAMLYS